MPSYRTLAPGQRCRILILDIETGATTLVHETTEHLLEAPNWTAGEELILNGEGVLWRMPAQADAEPTRIAIGGIPELNNDHVLAPDGDTIYLSANDWQIYAAPLSGGTARRITPDDEGMFHFLHGVSPDGSTLAYIGTRPLTDDLSGGWAVANVFTVGVDGSGTRALTAGTAPADGSEYSPDGEWIYFNTEQFSSAPGHAQIARMRADGTDVEQLTFDERVNWFPHVAPDGSTFYFLSFPTGTEGHPADRPVEIKLVRDNDWAGARTVATLFGGQGTINVNGWSPRGDRFAYVEYPID
ncbi:PD40 domain-containing protein [Microbacteriaceae bacterium VKM Ac-2855]|nr:PD40 domain-containing protein [Microbacteriaceae bacterium VKM Ac-2855]